MAPLAGISPLTVHFEANAQSSALISSYLWDFGDGTSSTNRITDHTYTVSTESRFVAMLSVTDQGVGIPADDLERIFERFQRATNVRSIAGTGIGLSGVRRIVELHGGSITVDSVEGQGSTFTVCLPLTEADGTE